MTLPLIHSLNKVDKETKRKMIYIIKNNNTDKEKVDWVIGKVNESGGIAYAQEMMNVYKQEALDILLQFPETPIRKGLEDMVRFVTDRKY